MVVGGSKPTRVCPISIPVLGKVDDLVIPICLRNVIDAANFYTDVGFAICDTVRLTGTDPARYIYKRTVFRLPLRE